LDERSVVVMDEAGMADTRRLSGLIERTSTAGSKLVLAGDSAQLGSIGAGGLFDAIRQEVPAAELSQVHRARNEWERQAWAQVRAGSAERALAAYQERDRLHVTDSRVEAAQRMVADWDRDRAKVGDGRSVMLTDASNREIDQINAFAQKARQARGELGRDGIGLPDRGYALFEGDRVMFAAPAYQPGATRVENGTLGIVCEVRSGEGLRVRTEEPEPREVAMGEHDAKQLRLGYAQHVYKAQGLTAERAHVLIGGWQTDRERAYVALTRARDRTDVYVSRDDLGEEGMDEGAIGRLADRMAESRAQEAGITREEASAGRGADRESEAGRALREQLEGERREPERDWHQSGSEQLDGCDEPRSEAGRILEEERAREAAQGLGIE
jgi:ATP-dependent exoDNAse (exonuclease V) alpha subunit